MVGLQVAVFAVLAFLFKRLLLSDTMSAVNRIKQVEAEVNKREEGVRRQIEEHERELSRKREDLDEETERRRQSCEQELKEHRESAAEQAQRDADEVIARAKKNVDKMRDELAREAQADAVGHAGEIFKLTFSERVTEAVNREFVGELIGALEELDADSIHVEADNATFVSSHPIDQEQKQRLQQIISDKFDISLQIDEQVDPDLLGGLSMKLGTLEIDGSLRSRFSEAAEEVKREAVSQ